MSDSTSNTVKVLLIEDEPQQAELIREILSRVPSPHYDTRIATSLKEGREKLLWEGTDVILLDLSLPDSKGLDSFTILSSDAPDLPVVILTGLQDEATGLEAVKKGAQEYLVKGEVDVQTVSRFLKFAIERKRVEIALRKSEERFQIASRATNDAIWDWDLATNQVWWSDSARTLFKLPAEEVGSDLAWWSERIHPEDKARFMSSVNAVIHSGWQFWSGEYRFRRGDGTYFPILDRGYVVQDREGTPIRMIGAMMDLSDRKKAEQTLRDFTVVLANALEGISSLDTEGRYFEINRAYAGLLGYAREEMAGMDWKTTIHPEDHARMEEAQRQMREEGRAEIEVRGMRKDGSFMHSHLMLIKGLDSEKNFTGYYQFMRDVTERKRMEEGLMQAQKMEAIAQLAGGIAHDFNNVLAALIGFARLAIDEAPEGSGLKTRLEQVLKSGERATKLVGEIASFSRPPAFSAASTGHLAAGDRKTAQQLDEMVREIVKFLRPTLPSNVFITTKIPSNLPAVVVEPGEIRQTLVNLCVNSCQAMPEGGTLTVSLESAELSEQAARDFSGALGPGTIGPGRYLVLSVEDTGGGIKPEDLPKIFDPSFSTKRGGSGMGLTAVLDFVKRQHGDARVQTEIGMGTRMEIFLPAVASAAPAAPKDESGVEGGKESILVVDDEDAVAQMLGELLGTMGYRATVKTSSSDALALFRENPKSFDLVVLDQIMPSMTGDKLAKEITGIRPGIPIILCSGYAHILSPERMREVGVRKFLNKPLGFKELEKEVRMLLDEAKAAGNPARVF